MELEFRKDFDEVRKNWELFWEGRLNRPLIIAIVPRRGKEPVNCPLFGAARHMQHDKLAEQILRWAESHEFVCDAVPQIAGNSIMMNFDAVLLGAQVIESRGEWGTDTKIVPLIKDLNRVDLKLRRDSPWWEKQADLNECLRRRFSGRLIFKVSGTSNLDTLAALRGTENLLMDFYDNPEGVHNVMRQIVKINNELMDESEQAPEIRQYGSVTSNGFYCDGIIRFPQCDFGYNIGREHFDEFALPYLKEEINRLDVAEYHLDGTGNLKHLESISTIEKIKVVQWQPGAGKRDEDWTHVYDKISALGKGLLLPVSSPEMGLRLWEKYGSAGRVVLAPRAETRDEALRFMDVFN